ncbi:MAG: hypothetical protein GYB66_12450 [Chloroflexi bacterium]|nr:hypothetical protein [Chloroflexota bacterium]
MMYVMILYVANDSQQARDMLQVWHRAGVSGVTMLESIGMQQLVRKGVLRDDLGPTPSIKSLFRTHEIHHRTIFSVLKEDGLETVLSACEDFVGDWTKPDVGVLFVWPVLHAFGLEKNFEQPDTD